MEQGAGCKRSAEDGAEPPAKRPQFGPKPLGFLDKLRVELETAAIIFRDLEGDPIKQLMAVGVGVALMPDEEKQDHEKYLGEVADLLTRAFGLPRHVTADLQKGRAKEFCKHWKNMPKGVGKMLLESCGMPQTARLGEQAKRAHTDAAGSVFTETPASSWSLLPWKLPFMRSLRAQFEAEQLKDMFPAQMERMQLELSRVDPSGDDEEGEMTLKRIAEQTEQLKKQCRWHVSGDGGKLHMPQHARDGTVKGLTVLHVDRPFTKGGKRFQAAFCTSTVETMLAATPLTEDGFALLEQQFDGPGGFKRMDQDKDLGNLMAEYAVGIKPGEIGTLFWTDQAPHGEIGSGFAKSADGTFRNYCGLKWLAGEFPVEKLISHAVMRLNGFDHDPFAIAANKHDPLFVNGKSCQAHPPGRDPIPAIPALLNASLQEKKKMLADNASDFFLEHNGLTRSDLL
jgi:hypothetical protein